MDILIFKKGDKVVWKEQSSTKDKTVQESLKEQFGEGPFVIRCIKETYGHLEKEKGFVLYLEGLEDPFGHALPFSPSHFALMPQAH